MLMGRKKKIRTEFRKKHQTRRRPRDLTRRYEQDGFEEDEAPRSERVSGKGDLTRKRTVVGVEVDEDETGLMVAPDVDLSECVPGRVLGIHGLTSDVLGDDGRRYDCATRQLLKSMSTDQRHVVAVGDRVMVRAVSESEGMIERVEPRRGVISRQSRGRQHVLVANVDQLLIISSAAEPALKPNLIDRFLVVAEGAEIQPIVCINKVDLVDPADLQPFIGVYGQMGYPVLLLSATSGVGIDRLKRMLHGKASVLAGQSGVGKSSLLNAIEPGLELRVSEVSADNQKGRHTTTSAKLIPLTKTDGFMVDTPGIRQMRLWDVIPEEVGGYYRDIRPYVDGCQFPDCSHLHELDCAVKHAVADGKIDVRRYESYCHLYRGD